MRISPVTPYRTTLCKENAYWMARLAQEVRKKRLDGSPNTGAILSSLQDDDPRFSGVFGYSEDSSQAMLVNHESYIAVAFRGTDELADWLDNLKVFPVQEIFGSFHRGFWKAVCVLWSQVIVDYKAVIKREGPKPLFLTGHSLGGAMASIAAAKLIHIDKPFTSCYTFGSPRCMGRSTARIYNGEAKDRTYRFCNNNDIVTRVPARITGYSHVGTFLYIDEGGSIHLDPGYWFQFVDCVKGATYDIGELGLDGVKDHNIDHYLKAITNWSF